MFLVPVAVLHDGAGVNTVWAADSEFGFVVDVPVRLKRSLNLRDRIRVHQYVFVAQITVAQGLHLRRIEEGHYPRR